LLTAVSFLAWGLVFPVSVILQTYSVTPPPYLWNLPKFFVAFGMILTLFENQTELATRAASQYQALFEGNLAGVYLSTVEGALLNCNSEFLHIFGFESKEEALAAPLLALYIEPSERDAFLATLDTVGEVSNYECRQRRRDGTLLWTLKAAAMITAEDGRRLIRGTVIDITERKQAEIALKQSEERFATIFRENPISCGIVSLDGVFLNANETMLRTLARPAEEVIGKSGVELGLWKSHQQRDRFYQKLRAEGHIHNLPVEFIDANEPRLEGLNFGTLVPVGDNQSL